MFSVSTKWMGKLEVKNELEDLFYPYRSHCSLLPGTEGHAELASVRAVSDCKCILLDKLLPAPTAPGVLCTGMWCIDEESFLPLRRGV